LSGYHIERLRRAVFERVPRGGACGADIFGKMKA
jgi:hypothetical protein